VFKANGSEYRTRMRDSPESNAPALTAKAGPGAPDTALKHSGVHLPDACGAARW
jgi:hypothetical protein